MERGFEGLFNSGQLRIVAGISSVFKWCHRRSGAASLVVLGICISFFLILPNHITAGTLSGLDLANRMEQVSHVSEFIENPHEFTCDECHAASGLKKASLVYNIRKDTIGFCRECHIPSHLHPVGVPAASAADEISRIWLPLGRGEYSGQIICLTCHYTHAEKYRRYLLRGDEEIGKDRQEYLCKSCHSDRIFARSPHDPQSKACSFCHTTIPEKGQSLGKILNPNVQASCDFCHGALDNAHFLSVNPFADPDVTWRFDKVGIPLLNGRFTCISCHDPHAYENRKKKMLRESYLVLASRSNHVDPHWKEVMCISCHEGEPGEGEPRLRFGGDINRLCDRCHDGVFARRDIHPVGVEPTDKVDIPDYMPLLKGKVTCSTCHNSSLQEGGERESSAREDNPKFLRKGFGARNEFCFRCHIQSEYEQMNAHKQLNESGEIREQSCLFCHTSQPNVLVIGIEQVGFDTESLDEYCTSCHGGPEYFENHPRGAHLVEPSEIILAAIETAPVRIGAELPLYNSKITCATCHNPHEKGVIRIEAAAKGADYPFRLRLGDSFLICRGCHTDK